MRILGNSYSEAGLRDDASHLREMVLALSRKVNGPDHSDTLKAMIDAGRSYTDAGRYADAIKLEEGALALSRKVNGPDHPDTLQVLSLLAFTYGSAGRPVEALRLGQEALALSRKVNGPDHPVTIDAMISLGNAYVADGQRAEAIAVREKTLALSQKVNGVGHRATLAAMNNLAESYASSGQWPQAVVVVSNLVEWSPGEHWWSHDFALLLAQTGDLEGRRRHCAQELAHFGSTDNPIVAWRIAEDCLILPGDVANMTGVAKLADVAVTKGKGHQEIAWFEFAKGLAEYRQGHFAGAVEWMQKVLASKPAANDLDCDASVDSLPAEADLVLAMAQRQLGQNAESRAAFAKGAEIIGTKLPKLESGADWRIWIIDHALLKEARALIEEPKTDSQ